MLTLLLALFALPARASDTGFLAPPTPRPLFRVARVGADGTLLQLDEEVLDRLLHRSRTGDVFTIPLPDADAALSFEHESIDPKKDLDCCSVTLQSGEGMARIPLTRSLSPRDFDLEYNGKTYQLRATGGGNFLVR
jgi:hypothetical protein